MNSTYKQAIIDYYDHTQLDYKILWFRKNNKSVHFGFYSEGIKSHSEALLNMNKVLAAKAEITKGDSILDAGCGQGGSSVWLAQNFDVVVNGITLVPHQVALATTHAKKNQVSSKVKFSAQDYTQTNFADESFSVIWACESLCHATHKEAFYKEAFRLLKPGGRIVCVDYFRTKRPHDQAGEELLHNWLNGWSIMDIDTAEEHQKKALGNGMIDFKIENINEFTKPSLQHLHSMASKLWKVGKFLRKIGLRNDINHGNQYGSIKQFEALENKLWFYGLLTVSKPK